MASVGCASHSAKEIGSAWSASGKVSASDGPLAVGATHELFFCNRAMTFRLCRKNFREI
jgi:hypothetical protein